MVLLWPIIGFTQLTDDFSDSNFTQNPLWIGSQEKFIINDNLQLQLQDNGEGQATLSTANIMANNLEWRLWIKLSFSPSTNNNARVYLMADESDLSANLNGYFLQMGESGSDDAIELFRQNGSEIVSICRGTEALISSSFELGLKIIRDENNQWTIFADLSGGENYQFQAQAIDGHIINTEYFGFYCKYTSSNSTKFYFDNIYVGDIIIDSNPPELISIETPNDSSINLTFNEVLEQSSAENINNYTVDNGFSNPIKAELNSSDATKVELVFSNKFNSGQQLSLIIKNIEDIYGNSIISHQSSFLYYKAIAYDILINELMIDPSPPLDLPEYEYLELFNPLEHQVSLNNWKLIIGSSEKIIENKSIGGESYLILAKENAELSLDGYGDFYGFSSFSLTNSSQDIKLISNDGILISSISYTDEWYNDVDKQEGGWSIEQINTDNICSGAENWRASIDVKGGSPGELNSVTSDLKLFPELSKFEMLDAKKIQLVFNQSMDSVSMTNQSHFVVNNQVGEAISIHFSGQKPQSNILSFTNDFEVGKTYEMMISRQVVNCYGEAMIKDTSIILGIPEDPNYMDLIINEVLFNPLGDGVDFVEIFNPSFKVIDLGKINISSVKMSPPNPADTTTYSISYEQYLLVPGAYICLSSSPNTVKDQYFTNNKNAFLKVKPFPPLNNDKGKVMLTSKSGVLLDEFSYNENMHYPLLEYFDGVSLERASFFQESNESTNWHSASENVGFATPAYQNSQFIGDIEIDESIVIEPEIFSPDNDGYNDLLSINYKFDQPGFMMTIDIYNSNGYPIRKLVNNMYLGTAGSVRWDGIKDDNTKASIGIYVIYIQVFDLDGNIKHFKKTAVLASKL